MHVPNVAAATNLQIVGRHLDAAASRLDGALDLDRGYRFRPWGMRSQVHARLDDAAAELRRAADALPKGGDGGFAAARMAVERLASAARATAFESLGPARNPAAYRRQHMREYAEAARGWGSVVDEGARLLGDLATTPATTRAAAIDVARTIGRDPTHDDLVRLAALDELPGALRPGLPLPVAAQVVHGLREPGGSLHGTAPMLGSWARRTQLLERPGFDRAAAVDELARALELDDLREALRMVAAIDQLPGHVRPDLPHVLNDWNWTSVHEYRNPGRHQDAVDALRSRVDDLRVSARLKPAPATTLDEVQRVLGASGSGVDPAAMRQLRDLPGVPPSLVSAEEPATAFDVVRARVWLDSQRLARMEGASREGMIAEVQRALDGLETGTTRRGGAGSGADLADRLEGDRSLGAPLSPHAALVRIAAVDALPAELRPDMPELLAVGSRIDAAAHQSPRAFDHRLDLLRLQAWASQFPRREAPTATADQVGRQVDRSALRRFLDPTTVDAGIAPLARGEQAGVLVDVLGGAASFPPRLHHGALMAAVRHLETSTVTDAQARALRDRTLELVRRNISYTEGIGNPGYIYHPDYAELGGIAQSVQLLRSFEQLAATTSSRAGTVSW